MRDIDPLRASATALAAAVRSGRIGALELVDQHIAAIEHWNPTLNAVVATRFEAARQEARAADEARARGESLGPLHGVPCTIKECFQVQGMPQTAGLVARVGLEVRQDAPTVRRLREAGAIVLGVTNTSELCMWMESSNRVYGRTNNPYDPRRTVGGSSGGEGAIIGAGASPFGLGSDVGGSIRMPAFFNGIFGHKPSPGRVPNQGQHPEASERTQRLLATGPLCRRAEDLAPLVRLLADDPQAVGPVEEGLPRRVLILRPRGVPRVSDAMRAAQHRAARCLEEAGARVEELDLPQLSRALEIWAAMMGEAQGPSSFRRQLQRPGAAQLGLQLGLWMIGRSPHTLPAIGLGLIENLGQWMPRRQARLVQAGHSLKAELEQKLGDGVALYPSYPSTAPRHGRALLPPVNYATTCIFNALQLPVSQAPLGLDESGLPLGVQIVGREGADTATIAAALQLERGLGGWVPPSAARGVG